MTKVELLTLASKAYAGEEAGASFFSEIYDEEMDAFDLMKLENLGDSLLTFVMRELADTFDADASDLNQLQLAECMMYSAIRQLEGIQESLAAAGLQAQIEDGLPLKH